MNTEISNFLGRFFNDANSDVQNPNTMMSRLILTVVVIFAWYWLGRLFKMAARKIIKNPKAVNVWAGIVNFIISIIGVISLILIWFNVADSMLLLLLLIVAIIFLSGKSLFDNIVGRIVLLQKHYFKLYDRIEINGIKGEVIRIRLFSFEMMEFGDLFDAEIPSGRSVRIPNKMILTEPVFNYNKITNIVWIEDIFSIQFNSDWQKAKKIIQEVGDKMLLPKVKECIKDANPEIIKRKLSVFDANLDIQYLVMLTDKGIDIKVIFPVYYMDIAQAKSGYNEAVLAKLLIEPDIEMVGNSQHISIDPEN